MIREFVLQLKRGSVRPRDFTRKYGVDLLDRNRLTALIELYKALGGGWDTNGHGATVRSHDHIITAAGSWGYISVDCDRQLW